MDKEQAKKLIKETFENPFDKDRFCYFVKNLLKTFEIKDVDYRIDYFPSTYAEYIDTFRVIGNYTDRNNTKIDILIIFLKKETTLL
ncbi:MAG: hypothetical protein N3D17_07325, partial [bacterium]|nr:hypothetical protein [bacterium]